MIGLKANGFAQDLTGFVQTAAEAEESAQVHVRIDRARCQSERAPVSGLGFSHTAQSAQRFAVVVVKTGDLRLNSNGDGNGINRQGVPAGLVRQHAEQVQRIRMPRIRLQDVAIARFRLEPLLRSMVFQSLLEAIGEVAHPADLRVRLLQRTQKGHQMHQFIGAHGLFQTRWHGREREFLPVRNPALLQTRDHTGRSF
jgi:hypothetical protein